MEEADLLKKNLDPFIVELEFDNFAIGFYARFPNIVIFRSWWTAKDALDKKVNLYNDYNFVKLASDSLSWHELIIIVRAAKDAHAFVIDADLYNEKKKHFSFRLIILILTGEKQFYIQIYFRFPDIAIIWHNSEDEDAFQFVIDADLNNGKKLLTTEEQLEIDDLGFNSGIYSHNFRFSIILSKFSVSYWN